MAWYPIPKIRIQLRKNINGGSRTKGRELQIMKQINKDRWIKQHKISYKKRSRQDLIKRYEKITKRERKREREKERERMNILPKKICFLTLFSVFQI